MKFLRTQVERECGHHRVDVVPSHVQLAEIPGPFEVIEYRRNRKGDLVRPGYALQLTFPEPVLAPFAIGYGAHFGLGQFSSTEHM